MNIFIESSVTKKMRSLNSILASFLLLLFLHPAASLPQPQTARLVLSNFVQMLILRIDNVVWCEKSVKSVSWLAGLDQVYSTSGLRDQIRWMSRYFNFLCLLICCLEKFCNPRRCRPHAFWAWKLATRVSWAWTLATPLQMGRQRCGSWLW